MINIENKYDFNVIKTSNLDLEEYYSFENKKLFTTLEWIEYIKEDSDSEPIIVRTKKTVHILTILLGRF